MKALSRNLLLFSTVSILLLAAAIPSFAVTPPGLIISDGTNTVTIDQGGNVTFSNGCVNCSTIVISAKPGSLTWVGTMGTFSSVQVSGTSKPILSGAPQVDLSIHVSATTGGDLNAMWSDVGFNNPDIINLDLTAGGNIHNGTASFSAFADNTNTPFGQGVSGGTLGPFQPIQFSGEVTGPGPTAAPFSMTESVTFSLNAGGQGGGDFFLQALPGPLSLVCPGGTGQANAQYSSSLNANGGVPPYTFSILSGLLPDGLSLDASGGGITGTPSSAGTSAFTAQVQDSDDPNSTASVQCSITIQPPTQLYEISGYTYSDNNVPPNMVYDNPPDNSIGGVNINLAACSDPTTSIASATTNGSGYYQFPNLTAGCYQITAPPTANSETSDTASTLTANIGPNSDNNNFGYITPGEISGYTYLDNNENQAYDGPDRPIPSVTVTLTDCNGLPVPNQPAVSTNGSGYYQFSNLPAGCYKVSAPPTENGDASDTPGTIMVTLQPGGTSDNNNFGYTPPAVTASCVAITAVQGVAIAPVTMTGSGGAGGPYTFTAMGLPPGVNISSSGTISGMPTASGTYNYTITVTDSAGNQGTVHCSVTVAPPVSSTCVSITAVQGVAIAPVTMTGSGGAGGPYTFTATGLPPGVSISTGGTISGTPTASGTYNYTITVTDSAGNQGTVHCSVTVAPPVSST
ncbi:MAG: putative Ig domain-containing protein, partial [Candidatus Korobacteraceae bacterium]